MEENQSLWVMPEDILRRIAKLLHYQDVIHLSMTCQHMKSILPSFMQIKGHNLDLTGPGVGHWIPECYFDTPRLTSSVQEITISMNWKDQGWGNRKGSIWIQLMRPTPDNTKCCTGSDRKGEFEFVVSKPQIVTEDRNIFEVAPHEEQKAVKILTRNDDVVSNAQCGDYFRFMKNVGGGGGHRLVVTEFNVVMQISSNSSCEN